MSFVFSRNDKRVVAFLAILVINLGVQYSLTRHYSFDDTIETSAAAMRRSWNASSISHSKPAVDHRNYTLAATNALHSEHLAYLPLSAWELESAGNERICNPSDRIPKYCCLGSTAWGGIIQHMQEKCFSVSFEWFQAPYPVSVCSSSTNHLLANR